MDKRKFTFKSLHKNLLLGEQSLEKTNSGSGQTSLHTTNIIMQDDTNSFNDEQLSDVELSVLKPLNTRPLIKSKSSTEDKKNKFCKNEDLLKKNNIIIKHKLSKNQTSILSSKSSQILERDVSSIRSQQSNYLSRNEVATTSKSSTATNFEVEKSITQKRKISSSSIDSDSDFDSSSNKYIKKKKHNEAIINTTTKYTDQNINTKNSSRKLLSQSHVSPIKPMTMSNISQKESQDKSKEFYFYTRSKQCNDNNKENSPKKSNFHTPSVFINYLWKCGIKLSTDGTYILSKFLYYTHVLFLIKNNILHTLKLYFSRCSFICCQAKIKNGIKLKAI